MLEYDFHLAEEKWRKQWEKEGLYQTGRQKEGKKYYALTMLPYTSGDLHMGHWYAMAPSDARARYKRMQGYKVLFPMGFDAFGLPAENAAIKHNIHPGKWTYANIRHMRQQLKNMGAMFDWDTEVITCDPDYYKWNQWLFLKFYEKGLAYKKHAPVDWCPNCNTTLAREQVVGDNRACERCDTPVEKRTLDQWFLKTTAYADELLDFSGLNWPEKIRVMQTNWIGRSRGVQFSLKVKDRDEAILVFTTRIETIFGATFIALAPEHPMVAAITAPEQAGLGGPWNSEGINGVTRFLNRVARLAMGQEPKSRARVVSPDDIHGFLHKTIKRVTEEMECFKFNTMISALMELSAFLAKNRGEGAQGNLLWAQAIDTLLLLLAPLTPVLSEEMWRRRGHKTSVHLQPWPTYDPEAISEKTVTVPIQINGKLRDTMVIPPGLAEEGALKAARGRAKVILALDGKTVIRTVWVPDKLLNLVVK